MTIAENNESKKQRYNAISAAEFLDIIIKNKKAKYLTIQGDICFSNIIVASSLDIQNCVFESEVSIKSNANIKKLFFTYCVFKQRLLITNCKFTIFSFKSCTFEQYFYSKNLESKTYKIESCIIKNSKELRLTEFIADQFIFTKNEANSDIYIKPTNIYESVIIQGSESHYLIIFSNNDNPNIIDKFLIFSYSHYRTDYSIRNVKTNFLHINGELKDSSLTFHSVTLKSGLMDYFSNFGNLRFNILNPLTDDSIIIIKNSILGKTIISSIDFTNFKRIVLSNSNLIEINSVNIIWCKYKNLNCNDLNSIKEDFRQLKVIAARNEDIPTKLYFQKLEMHSYLKQLKMHKGHLIDKLILKTNYLSNDFGLNWFFAFAWLIGLSILWYTLIKFSLGYTIYDSSLIADEIGRFLTFLNPIHQFDKLFKSETMDGNLNGALLFDGLSRITNAYLLYQFVSAFRKYSKR